MRLLTLLIVVAFALSPAAAQSSRAQDQGPTHRAVVDAALTPDGRLFLARERGAASNSVSLFDLDNRTRTVITFDRRLLRISAANISPNGRTIALQIELLPDDFHRPRSPNQPNGLLIVDLSDGTTTLLPSREKHGPPSFSPDGRSIYYGRSDDLTFHPYPTALRLYRYDRDTGIETRLSDQSYETIRDIFAPPGEDGIYFRFNRPFRPDGTGLQVERPDYLTDLPSWDEPIFYHTYWAFDTPLTPWPRPVVPVKQAQINTLGPDGAAYGSAPPQADNLLRRMAAYGVSRREREPARWRIWRFTPDTQMETLTEVPSLGEPWVIQPIYSPEDEYWVGATASSLRAPLELIVMSESGIERFEMERLPATTMTLAVDWPQDLEPNAHRE